MLLHTALGILHTHRRRGKVAVFCTQIFFFVIKIKIKTRTVFLGWYFAHRKKNQFFHVQNTLVGFVAHNFLIENLIR